MSGISPALAHHLRREFSLDWHGIHGGAHWARVRRNGLLLARETGAHRKVVELFAFLHDARRRDEYTDRGHGARGAELARELEGRFFTLDAEERRLLDWACRGHSEGHLHAHVTVQTCWDADRLDLGRVGMRPDPSRLCTATAREPALLAAAYRRSLGGR